MKKAANIFFTALVALAPLTTVTHNATAGIRGSAEAIVIRTNGEGFRNCRARADTGQTYFRGKVRGTLLDGGRRGGHSPFQVSTCFSSAQACANWAERITHTIPGVEYINYTSCSVR